MELIKVLTKALIVLLISSLTLGCAEMTISMVEHQPQVSNPSHITHPDEITIRPDGKVSYKKGVTGEDIIRQLRGEPIKEGEYPGDPEFNKLGLRMKMLWYKHDQFSPVACHTSPRQTGCSDVIILLYDPAYGVFTYRDMFIMEACDGPSMDQKEMQQFEQFLRRCVP